MKTKKFEQILHKWGTDNNISINTYFSGDNGDLNTKLRIIGFDRKTNREVLNIVVMGKNVDTKTLKKQMINTIFKAGLTHLTKTYLTELNLKGKRNGRS